MCQYKANYNATRKSLSRSIDDARVYSTEEDKNKHSEATFEDQKSIYSIFDTSSDSRVQNPVETPALSVLIETKPSSINSQQLG